MSENRFLLAGEVLAVNEDSIIMETVESRPSGEYPDEHEVFVDNADVAPGQRIMIMGSVDQTEDRRLILTATNENIREHDSTIDMNLARISGRLDRTFEYFEAVPDENKRAFGNLLMVIEERFYMRAVVLTAAQAIKMDRSEKYLKNAEIQVEGRLQTRPFVSQGEDRIALEVVLDTVKILTPADASDPFEKFGKKTEAAI